MAEARPASDVRYVHRGEEHSASYQRQQAEARLLPGTDYSLPRKHHVDQSIDFSGIFRASAHKPIPSDNKGYIMLKKMGWTGSGLGKGVTGRTAPIDTDAVAAGSQQGLGRAAHEGELIASETARRRQLTAEARLCEDDAARAQRLQRVHEQARVQETVREMQRDFYCEVCSKQYKSVMEMEEHLSSYDHHHTKRLKEMKAMERERTREQRSKSDAKRAAKEAARLQKQIATAQAAVGAGAPDIQALAPAPQQPVAAAPSLHAMQPKVPGWSAPAISGPAEAPPPLPLPEEEGAAHTASHRPVVGGAAWHRGNAWQALGVSRPEQAWAAPAAAPSAPAGAASESERGWHTNVEAAAVPAAGLGFALGTAPSSSLQADVHRGARLSSGSAGPAAALMASKPAVAKQRGVASMFGASDDDD